MTDGILDPARIMSNYGKSVRGCLQINETKSFNAFSRGMEGMTNKSASDIRF